MKFRGDTTVFARCDAKGAPIARGGRVEIRYNRGDERIYRAALANLAAVPAAEPFDDPAVDGDTSAGGAADPTPASNGKGAPVPTRIAPIPGRNEALPPVVAERDARDADIATEGPPVIAYADGACTGNPGPAGLGILLLDGEQRHERSEALGHGTNNIAELTAVLRTLEAVPKERALEIRTDSQYAIGLLSKGWKPKANQELVAAIKDRLRGRKVRFTHVRGHAGIAGNERADALARASIDRGGGTGWFTR